MLGMEQDRMRQLAQVWHGPEIIEGDSVFEVYLMCLAVRVTPRQSVPGGRRGGNPRSQQMSYIDT